MAPARRQTNGRSPLVNKQGQITSFFSKLTSSSVQSPTSIPPMEALENRRGADPAAHKSPSPSSSPTTPSPLQPKRKKPLLTIPSAISPSAALQSHGTQVVGKRVRVYWPLDEAWYEGSVKSYDENSNRHVVLYDDGEEEALELAKEKIEWVEESERKFKRLRRGCGAGVAEEVVGVVDDEAVQDEVEEDGDDDDDEDWGKGKVLKEDCDDDSDDVELVNDDSEDSGKAVGRVSGKSRTRKRNVKDVKVEECGKTKKKCSSSSGGEGKAENQVSMLGNKGSKFKGQ